MSEAAAQRGRVMVSRRRIKHSDGTFTLEYDGMAGQWATVQQSVDGSISDVKAGRGARRARLHRDHPVLSVIEVYERSEAPADRVLPLIRARLPERGW